jgi:hypothetical protein
LEHFHVLRSPHPAISQRLEHLLIPRFGNETSDRNNRVRVQRLTIFNSGGVVGFTGGGGEGVQVPLEDAFGFGVGGGGGELVVGPVRNGEVVDEFGGGLIASPLVAGAAYFGCGRCEIVPVLFIPIGRCTSGLSGFGSA